MYKAIIVKNKLSTVQVSRIAPRLAPVTRSPDGQIAYGSKQHGYVIIMYIKWQTA